MMSKRATVLCLSGLSLLGLAGCAEKNLYDCYQGALDADERRDCIATGKADVTVEAGGSRSNGIRRAKSMPTTPKSASSSRVRSMAARSARMR